LQTNPIRAIGDCGLKIGDLEQWMCGMLECEIQGVKS